MALHQSDPHQTRSGHADLERELAFLDNEAATGATACDPMEWLSIALPREPAGSGMRTSAQIVSIGTLAPRFCSVWFNRE
jgi:hypothetical protein